MFDPEYARALFTSFSIAMVVFAATLLILPRVSLPPLKNPAPALISICLFLPWFILHFGRHQFGGYDYNLVLDLGWRQHLGQRPYLDFPTTTPPGFNLGIKLAYALFGVSWDANLYLTALFAVLTFLWLYWLFRRLAVPILPALAVSFAIECAANLLLSFWWYNNTTLTLAAIFFLSTLLCTRHLLEGDPLAQLPHQLLSQYSFVLSLALLSLFKPNLAALTILPGVLILLIAAGFGRGEKRCHPERSAKHAVEGPRQTTPHLESSDHLPHDSVAHPSKAKPRNLLPQTLALILAAATLATAILTLNHISIPVLLSAYRGVAEERGLTLIGFSLMQPLEKLLALFWLPFLSIPLLALIPQLRTQLRQRDLRALAATLFLFTGPLIALYGIAANGEFRSVECTVLLAASAIAVFAPTFNSGQPLAATIPNARLRRIAVAILCASIASDLYQAVIRLRVAGIGPHMFFEWSDNDNLIPSGVLKNMRVSATMIELEREIAQAHAGNPGPTFFGPRVDFNYSVLNIPSPVHLPLWWQPGTAFPRSAVPALLATWESDRFQTLIFLKDDTTYYPDEFLDRIARNYTRDDRYPALTLYHRNP